MNAELEIWLVYGLAAAGSVFSFIFFINFLAAPWRFQRARAEDAEDRLASLQNKFTELEGSTPFSNTILRSLDEKHSESDEIHNRLRVLAAIRVQYDRLLSSALTLSASRGAPVEDQDIAIVAKFISEELQNFLPEIEPGPDEPLVLKTGWNRYRYVFSSPKPIVPKVIFDPLPREISFQILRVSRIDFEVSFIHTESGNRDAVPPQPCLIDTEA